MASPRQDHNYIDSGYDSFMSKSIDGVSAFNLDTIRPPFNPLQVAYDRTQVQGSLGDKLTLGNVTIDGTTGRISISDGTNTRVILGNF